MRLVAACVVATSLLSVLPLFAEVRRPDYQQEIIEREASRQLDRCADTVQQGADGSKLEVVRRVLGSCQFREVNPNAVLWSRVPGANTPQSFSSGLRRERERVKAAAERQNRDDEVETVNLFYRFDEVVPTELLSSGSVLGEQGVKLAGNVTQVLLHLQRSDDLADFANRHRGQQGPGIQELMELAYAASLARNSQHHCREAVQFAQLPKDSPETEAILWSAQGRSPHGQRGTPLQLFFGLKEKEDLEKLNAFRWQKDGKFYYLFRQRDEDATKWALGEYEPASGEMKMRTFRVVNRDQLARLEGGIESLTPKAGTSTRLEVGDVKSELSAEVGLQIDTYKESLPWGGEVTLPRGTVTLSQLKMVHVSDEYYGDHQVDLQVDGVQVRSGIAPVKSDLWQANFSGSIRKEEDGRESWSAGTNVRVYNFTAGYRKQDTGSETVSFGLVGEESYVQYDTNLTNSRRVTVGRVFGRDRRAAAAIRTDLEKKTHEIQVIVFF